MEESHQAVLPESGVPCEDFPELPPPCASRQNPVMAGGLSGGACKGPVPPLTLVSFKQDRAGGP